MRRGLRQPTVARPGPCVRPCPYMRSLFKAVRGVHRLIVRSGPFGRPDPAYSRIMARPKPQPGEARKSGRDRILDAAYPLFSRSGIRAVGVDTVVEAASVAK